MDIEKYLKMKIDGVRMRQIPNEDVPNADKDATYLFVEMKPKEVKLTQVISLALTSARQYKKQLKGKKNES